MNPKCYFTPTFRERLKSLLGKKINYELMLNLNLPACVIEWNDFYKKKSFSEGKYIPLLTWNTF